MEEYASKFEDLQFQIEMHNSGYDTMFFVTQFTKGLKPDISAAVQSQLPKTMERVVMLAKIQQQLWKSTSTNSRRVWVLTDFQYLL